MNKQNNELFYQYFHDWFELFKKADIRPVTAQKYVAAEESIKELAPDLTLDQINRMQVQKLLVLYGKNHELSTAKGFFHLIKACLEDARYNHLIDDDPTYKLKPSSQKEHHSTKVKYLERDQAEKLINTFKKSNSVASDMFDFDIRTGLRFAELLGLTRQDIDTVHKTITVNKSWQYKKGIKADFGETKNKASHRTIVVDDQALSDITKYFDQCGDQEPIFVKAFSDERGFKPTKNQKYVGVYNSTLVNELAKFCKESGVPRIGIHGLRHTHASFLFYADVSILSISKRLGHANTKTTEQVYLHLIKDKAAQDDQQTLEALNAL